MKKPDSKNINDLLLNEWDPIGVVGIRGAEDEYARYVNDISTLIQQSPSCKILFEYLWDLETEHMGLKGNKKRTESFAKLLLKSNYTI